MKFYLNKPSYYLAVSIFLLFLVAPLSTASAHPLSAGFTDIDISEQQTQLTYSIDALSVIEGFGGDTNNDGKLNETELKAIEHRVSEWVEDSVVLEKDGQELSSEVTGPLLENKGENEMVTLKFQYPGFAPGQTISLLDGMFTSGTTASAYTNFLTSQNHGSVSESVLRGKDRIWTMLITEQQLDQGQQSHSTKAISSWWSFFTLGMEHILTGYDHLLFLLALLIRQQTLKQYVAVISAFTVAHTITLTLAVLGILNIPTYIVEPAIALSICYVAVENIIRGKTSGRWVITFLFGLVHGMGFADLLKEMNISWTHLAASLISFNIGIEVVQLAIVMLLLPILTRLFRFSAYRKYVNYSSIVIFILGAIWFLQRV
ncbi:HupE/UreJ family protein [Paenibacillus montanisoli]|uniref:HupE/UreJ family protein n=1 Tax=Paenibacillus montanisoli TaxID=2081970 RepID=A0A328TT42_9BACL|nr:HupE/UreJ family protein [Paenibacillus montanisoli]RAP73759.1 HupE/UreJ family protein [Paenibacillus montanisoli]